MEKLLACTFLKIADPLLSYAVLEVSIDAAKA